MKRKYNSSKGNCPLPLHVYLAYLLVCTLLLTGVSFARYVSDANADDSAQVAKGVVTVSYDDSTTVTLEQPDNYDEPQTGEFTFTVSSAGSEVAIRYDIVLNLAQPLPTGVTIRLYKNGDPTPIHVFHYNGGTEVTVPDAGMFEAGRQATDQYTLTFEGDYNIIQECYDGTVSISVQAAQID